MPTNPTRTQRRQRWEDDYDALDALIDTATAREDVEALPWLRLALEDMDDQRCESCGRFEDDPDNYHAAWCQWATCPRPSIDAASSVLEQLGQALLVLRMDWGRS